MDFSVEEESPIPTVDLILTPDGVKLFKIRRTVMEMLRDREYLVSDLELHRSRDRDHFRETFGPFPTRHALGFKTHKLLNPEDGILVIFPVLPEEKEMTGKVTMTECVEAMKLNGTQRAVLVAQKDLTGPAKQYINEIDKEYKLEVFKEAELLVNITHSAFVPKHQILFPQERQALLEKYSTNEKQLPTLCRTDPVARYYGLETGQVVKIVRRSDSASKGTTAKHETINYRSVN